MLWVEEKLAQEILPELFEQVHAVDLKYAVERHLLETRAHVRRLRSALHLLGERGEPEQSAALLGLRDEHAQLYEHVDAGRDEVVDLVHADAIAKTEHLEIAAYTRLRSTANALGEEEIAMMLQEVLEQEKHALELAERALAKLLAER
jgi:ferritin-like metal-binding protein YciE